MQRHRIVWWSSALSQTVKLSQRFTWVWAQLTLSGTQQFFHQNLDTCILNIWKHLGFSGMSGGWSRFCSQPLFADTKSQPSPMFQSSRGFCSKRIPDFRFQEQTFSFNLTPAQATGVNGSIYRDEFGRPEYKKQVRSSTDNVPSSQDRSRTIVPTSSSILSPKIAGVG